MPGFPGFRQQSEAKAPWSLDENTRQGFSQSVNNNQPQMALYYVQELVKEYDVVIAELKAKVAQLEVVVKPDVTNDEGELKTLVAKLEAEVKKLAVEVEKKVTPPVAKTPGRATAKKVADES